MENTKKILRYGMLTLGLVTSYLFQSCNNESFDVRGETQNIVYMNLQEWSPADCPKNTFLYNVFRTPVSATLTSGVNAILKVKCTQPASQDIKVTLDIDRSTKMEGYTSFPAEVEVALDKKELVIAKGEMESSERITVSIEEGKWNLFQENVYLLPISITSVSNAELSQLLSSAYVAVKSSYSNCVSGATTVPGAKIANRVGWAATVDGNSIGANIFDGVTSTYTSFNAGTLEVDLQQVYSNVSGMQFGFSSTAYAMTGATVYTSATGQDDYEWQGKLTITRANTESVQFYGPVSARYIKVVMTPYNVNYGMRLTEFNVFEKAD